MHPQAENIKSLLDRPVVMIGLMGAGKTRIGSVMARQLGMKFIDADQEIESTAGLSITDIFEKYGEPSFRDLERKVMTRLLSAGPVIIATGGGAVMNEQTGRLIWTSSIAIWIRASLDILVERTAVNDKRPLLKNGNPREILQRLVDVRYPVYAAAPITIDTDSGEAEKTAAHAIAALAAYLKRN